MTGPRLVLDTNVIIGAFERQEADCRSLIQSGRDDRAVLGVSLTLDEELGGSEFPADELWQYVKQLPRMPRPSAQLGRARYGEAEYGYGGLGGSLAQGKGDQQVGRNIRDEEHVEGADAWGADAFVTKEAGLLKRKALLGVRIVSPSEAAELIESAFSAS
jgi:hypothetical protein